MTDTTLIDRAVIRLSGEDVRGFLQGLVTNDTAGIFPVWAGLLSPQGKALFDFILWADGEDVLIDCEAEQADAIVRRLSMYRLRRKILIARDEAIGVHWALNNVQTLDPRLPALGSRWLAAPGKAADGWRKHRLLQGVAEGVAELGSDKTLWLECNADALNGVNFTKGCYVGQENTARMNYRQKVNRRLLVVKTDNDPGDLAMAWYPDLGLAVMRVRVEALSEPMPAGEAILPAWLQEAIA